VFGSPGASFSSTTSLLIYFSGREWAIVLTSHRSFNTFAVIHGPQKVAVECGSRTRLCKPNESRLRAHTPRPGLARCTTRVGPCTLTPRRIYFITLCKSIFTQQISTKIAGISMAAILRLFPAPANARRGHRLLAHDHHAKHCGLSRQKRGYLIDLAKHLRSGAIPTRRLAGMSDEEVIECLTRVNGVGR